MVDCPLVLIKWEDSAQPVAAWQYISDIGELSVVKCQSVGFLVHDDDGIKMLAPNVGDLDGPHAQASGVIRISARCVTEIRRLSVGRRVTSSCPAPSAYPAAE